MTGAAHSILFNLKDKALGQIAIVRVRVVGKKVPERDLDLVLCNFLTAASLLIVGRSLGTKEPFTNVSITRLTEAFIKEWGVPAVEGQGTDAVFEACTRGYASFITSQHFKVFNFS